MCGLAGILSPGFGEAKLRDAVGRMTMAIAHRGPDGDGHWCDPAAGIALGHRRLAIIDLTPAGGQPMQSGSGRYTIVYNGEIYNYRELRTQLQKVGAVFCSESDTEVLLAGFEHWGIEATLRAINGMFAIALWDSVECSLRLMRDRFGQKPLAYGWIGSAFVFASELKAIEAYPGFAADMDPEAVHLLLRYGNVPAPRSIWRGFRKLLPGHLLQLPNTITVGVLPVSSPYWSAEAAAQAGLDTPFNGSREDAVAELDHLLRDAVRGCMVSDVPLGAFLSGGIDSSVIVAVMQAFSGTPIRSFSIGFRDPALDEAPYASAVAAHLGTRHTELYVDEVDALAVVPALGEMFDEPFADSSQIPTYLVSRLARQQVTVSLSGDGGDELFGGYDRYRLAQRLAQAAGCLPRPLLSLACAMMRVAPVSLLNGLRPALGDRLWRLGHALQPGEIRGIYARLLWQSSLLENSIVEDLREQVRDWPALDDPRHMMMLLDARTYLPDDILVKLDRTSMAVSLEARVPLLDHRLYEFAWRLPLAHKFGARGGKAVLRDVLLRYIPAALIDRPKKGFGVPLQRWLSGPLRGWADDLLAPAALRQSGMLDAERIGQLWQQHRNGERSWHHALWCVLMFQAWRQARR